MSDVSQAPVEEEIHVMTRSEMNTMIFQAMQEHLINTVDLKTNLINKFASWIQQLLGGTGPTGEQEQVEAEAAAAGEEAQSGESIGEDVAEQITTDNAGNTGGS